MRRLHWRGRKKIPIYFRVTQEMSHPPCLNAFVLREVPLLGINLNFVFKAYPFWGSQ